MQAVNFVIGLLQSLAGSNSTVAHYLGIVVSVSIIASLALNSLTGLWNAVVLFLNQMSAAPGCAFMAKWAATLQEDAKAVESFESGFLLPLLNSIVLIKLPTAPLSPAAPAQPVAPVVAPVTPPPATS